MCACATVPVNDGRRLEVVVDGLPVFGGAQLAVDTTVVSSLHCGGSPHRGALDVDGLADRAHVPRVGPARTQSQVGGVGRRCRGAMV